MGGTPLEEIMRWAGLNGFRCLEVMSHLVPRTTKDATASAGERAIEGVGQLEIADLTDAKVAGLKGLMEETGVRFSSLAYYPNLLHPTMGPPAREFTFQVIDAAARLGCNWTTQVGRDPQLNIEDNFDLFEKVWPDLVDYAGKKGVKIAVDNCARLSTEFEWPAGFNMATNPLVWRRMFEICPQKNFGLHLDTWHFVYQRIDPEYAISNFGDRIISVRATDGRWNQNMSNETGTVAVLPYSLVQQRIIGTGDLKLGNVFGALWRVGFNDDVIIEHEHRPGAFHGSVGIKKALLLGKRLVEPYLT